MRQYHFYETYVLFRETTGYDSCTRSRVRLFVGELTSKSPRDGGTLKQICFDSAENTAKETGMLPPRRQKRSIQPDSGPQSRSAVGQTCEHVEIFAVTRFVPEIFAGDILRRYSTAQKFDMIL